MKPGKMDEAIGMYHDSVVVIRATATPCICVTPCRRSAAGLANGETT